MQCVVAAARTTRFPALSRCGKRDGKRSYCFLSAAAHCKMHAPTKPAYMLRALLYLLFLFLAGGAAVPTFVRASYFERLASSSQKISGFPFQVQGTAGNHVVCVVNIRGSDGGSKSTVRVNSVKLDFLVEARMPSQSAPTNTLLGFFYVAQTTGFSSVIITTFAINAGGEMHCSEVSGATGMDAYAKSVFPNGFTANVNIKTLCSDDLIIVANGAATMAVAASLSGTRDAFSPKKGGLSHFVLSGAATPQQTLMMTSFPSSPSPGAMAVIAIALSGCSTAEPSACPLGATTCACGGSYCVGTFSCACVSICL